MEKANTLNQMKQYDFGTPINVTMIFEDSDDGSLVNNVLREQIIEINDDEYINKPVTLKNNTEKENSDQDTSSKLISANKNLERDSVMKKNETTNGLNIALNVEESEFTVRSSRSHLEDSDENMDYTQRPLIQNNCVTNLTDTYGSNTPERQQLLSDTEVQFANIGLLNIVSEHLILIMRPYYHLNSRIRDNNDQDNLTKQLNNLKMHLFDLSYSTVLMLILPQENNKLFVEKFLDKTVSHANHAFNWNCERKHVEPFYNEMIKWVKKKREHVKKLALRTSKTINNGKKKDENLVLRKYLGCSSQTVNNNIHTTNNCKRLDTGVPKAHDGVTSKENNMCIFSIGDPGKEIRINVNPKILGNHMRQHCTPIEKDLTKTQMNSNKDVYSSNSPSYSKQVQYDQCVNYTQQNGRYKHTVPYRPNLPPYPGVQNVNTSNLTPTIIQNLNQLQNNFAPNTNYHTRINNNSFATSVCNNSNIAQMYYRAVEQDLSTAQMTYPTMGRCFICGKATTSRCSKCNEFSYCSSLCQELDAGSKCKSCN